MLTPSSRRYERAKTAPRRKIASEIGRLEYDRHFNSTSGASFHSDHTNLGIGMMQIMTGESSKIFYSCLAGRGRGRDPVNKRRMRKVGLDKARCNVRRNVGNGIMFLIYLQRNVLSMWYLRKMNRYPLKHLAELVLG
jgi:hypothetical protein